jgi:hypothetical protein
MKDDDLDHLLMEREEIVPSSGFLASVMEAVQQEATAPAPIPFPWKWALPGLIVAVSITVGMITRWLYSGIPVSHPAHPAASRMSMETLSASLPQMQTATSTVVALEWSALALVISFAAFWISMRISGVRE